jgi:hypothetical protein
MRYVGHAICVGEMRNMYTILIEKAERINCLGVNKMDVK